MTTTFGIEEEFVLLDASTLRPVDVGGLAVAELSDDLPGAVTREFFPSQVEYASPVCTTTDDAMDALIAFRSRLVSWADGAGVVVAATGTPFRTSAGETISPGERYGRIADDIAGLTAEHQINGLHVHVAIPDRDAGVRASNALRPWLPVLLALSADSPYWHGEDTGFDSWRSIHGRRWPTFGIPPWFRDAREYDAAIAAVTGVGATSDPGTINWNVRLSSAHPTVEVRVCDAQLDPSASVALAAIIRALAEEGMERPTEPPLAFDAATWDTALWHAARYGVSNGLVHPHTRALVPAEEVMEALSTHIGGRSASDSRLIGEMIDRVLRDGNGATAQRAVYRSGGAPALAALYRERLTRAAVRSAASAEPRP